MPVANAGPDQLTQSLMPVTFSGAGSSDPDGTLMAYAWSFGDGTTASGMTVSKTYARPGTYTASLTVTDDRGGSGSDTAIVRVSNRLPVANAGADQTAVAGATVTFDGSGSSDPDGSIASAVWTFGDGATATGLTVSHAFATAGTYTAALTVTDDAGATASDSATVTVTDATATPWAVRAGGAGFDEGMAVAVAANGDLIVAGDVVGPADFGGVTCANSIVIARYPAAGGRPLWLQCLGGAGGGSGRALAIDPATGDVVVAGYFRGTVDFGAGPLSSPQGYNVFLARYSATGQPEWAEQFGSPLAGAIVTESAYGVAIDPSGNILLTGMFEGTADFGTGPMTSAGQSDVFLAKYTATGAAVWAQRFGGPYGDVGYGVAVDAAGNIVVTGTFFSAVDFGGGVLDGQSADVFVAKYSPAGAHLWSKRFGGTLADEGHGVAVDAGGNVYVTGVFQNTIDLGGGPVLSAGGNDIFVAKYTPAGAWVWSRTFGSVSNFDNGTAIAVDAGGNVVIAGTFTRSVDFGTGLLTSAGSIDAFVAKYSSAGTPAWAKRWGSTNIDSAYGVAVDAAGDVAVTGDYFIGVDFGAGVLPSAGSADLFLMKLAP